jgi:hypothetical protein
MLLNTEDNSAKQLSALAVENQEAIDLNSPGMAKAVAQRIKEDVDLYCEQYNDGHRSHLGASLIGNECSRYLWYIFRWCFNEKLSGRTCRVFDRGHREEQRFIEWLRGIGCQVWEFQSDGVTQFRISDIDEHFGGSLDGIAILPAKYKIKEPILLEFKTHNTGRGWSELNEKGVIIQMPKHFAQTSTYGLKYNLRYCLYQSINKNDDDIYCEVVKLDHELGRQMIAKAERIIKSPIAPARLSDTPTFQTCVFCSMKHICHFNKTPEHNCRSCKDATPAENAQWFCKHFGNIIPKDFIKKGCEAWKSITNNV